MDKSGGTLMYGPEKCCKVVVACCMLHNICIAANIPLDNDGSSSESADSSDDSDEEDGYDGGNVADGAEHDQDGVQVRNALVANRF